VIWIPQTATMVGRRNSGKASPLFLVLLALSFCFVTYNLVTAIIQYGSIGREVGDNSYDRLSNDPIIEMPENVRKRKTKAPFHVALTATDAPYSKWQCRIMYYWYKKKKNLPESEMGGFTRILHSGQPDNLMDEIPTMVVDPLPAGVDRVRFLLPYHTSSHSLTC